MTIIEEHMMYCVKCKKYTIFIRKDYNRPKCEMCYYEI